MNLSFGRAAASVVMLGALCACGGGAANAPLPVAPHAVVPVVPVSAEATVPQAASRGISVSVTLPLRNSDALDNLLANQTDRSSPLFHHFVTPAQFREQFGPSQADLSAADAYLRAQGFITHVTTQGLIADGATAAIERTFNVHLRAVQTTRRGQAAVTALAADRVATLAPALQRTGATVAFPALAYHVDSMKQSTAVLDNRYGVNGPYWFTDLKQAYSYPSYTSDNGSGRTIAVVVSSDVNDADTALYFNHEGLTPVPSVERRPVLGGAPFNANSVDSDEASLDVQQALGSAPGAHLLLYDTPNLFDQSIFAAYTAVVEDNRADIVTSSFGGCELYYTKAYNSGLDYTTILKQFHNLYRQGNAQGISFLAASGDSGGYECFDPSGSQKILGGASSPASDPNVTAVGGTNLQTTYVPGSRHSAYVSENAEDDPLDPTQGYAPNDVWGSGGGISQIFSKPLYQRLVNTHSAYRTVPDVAMHMGGCPYGTVADCTKLARSADVTAIGGKLYLLIGTSASTPEFAGLLAVTESRLGTRLGNANDYIYALAAGGGSLFFHNNIPGNNGYPSTPGYNYVVGNGTPKAAAFSASFGPFAGDPLTPTNP